MLCPPSLPEALKSVSDSGSVLWGPTTPVERSVGRLEVVDGRGGICKKRLDDGMSSADFVAGVLYWSPLNGLLDSRMIQPPFHSS